ncbi:MAG: hypothetical protein U0441_03070 [Polyangiaceae bacterium]
MRRTKRFWCGLVTAAALVLGLGCGGESSGSGASNGGSTAGSGGTGTTTGGLTTTDAGGSTASGGSTTTGGSTASGGSTTTESGGSTASGGTGGSSTAGSGGSTASGGAGGVTTTSSGCSSAADCDDGLFCNGAEACVAGVCVAGSSACDDGVSCTADTCDEANDTCAHAASDALCDNGIACDGAEVCSPILGCLSGGASCDDGVSCTDDFCDLGSGQCVHVKNDNACQDGLFCDGVEVCDPMNGAPGTGCVAGLAVGCDDGIACTADACDEAAKGCAHTPNSALCDDGMFCNGAEVCVLGLGCQAGAPVGCDDGRSCTIDACNEVQKMCSHVPNNAACNDGLACNGVETCSGNGPAPTGCVAGAPIPCGSDGIACTVDACDEATVTCKHTPNNAACNNGLICTPAAGGCAPPPQCQVSADCNDNNACNGAETCVMGQCQPGAPVSCNDNIDCTIDSCDPANGACSHAPNNAVCDDGFTCDGIETCDAQTGCVSGAPVTCDDGVDCTADACVEPGGTCVFTPVNGNCSDGQLCNGMEICTPNGCAPGAPYVCPSDGIGCTQEVCDPAVNACVSVPHDDLCPCGQTCNAAQGGCGNFCAVSTCQGKVYACGDCIDNDGDCAVDSNDSQCLGPCDNTEDGFYGGIPGQNNSPCKSDCYFDQDTGSGNDDCYWSHKCDPLEVGPSYPPEGSQCAYNPNANIPGYGGGCSSAFSMQSMACQSYCGPLTPNGCDCFGCCAIPGAPTTVWLGSENPAGVGSCNLQTLNDPTKCKPCTQVQSCLNTCEHCELCVGKPTLPPDCFTQSCPAEIQPCGAQGQSPCPMGFTCITGCCQQNPQ